MPRKRRKKDDNLSKENIAGSVVGRRPSLGTGTSAKGTKFKAMTVAVRREASKLRRSSGGAEILSRYVIC